MHDGCVIVGRSTLNIQLGDTNLGPGCSESGKSSEGTASATRLCVVDSAVVFKKEQGWDTHAKMHLGTDTIDQLAGRVDAVDQSDHAYVPYLMRWRGSLSEGLEAYL